MYYWNRLIKLRNAQPKNSELWKKTDSLLAQYNTAGGRMIRDEVKLFLEEHEKSVKKLGG